MVAVKAGSALQERLDAAMDALGLKEWGRASLAAKWAGMTPGGMQRAIERSSLLKGEHAAALARNLSEELLHAGYEVDEFSLSVYLEKGGAKPWTRGQNGGTGTRESAKLTVDAENWPIVLCLQQAAAAQGVDLFRDVESGAIERHMSTLKANVDSGIPANSQTLLEIAKILLTAD